MPPLPGVQGQNYTLDDVVQALINAGVTSYNMLVHGAEIAAGENARGGTGNTNSLNDYEYAQGVPTSKLASGPFQVIPTWHPNFDQAQGLTSLQYNANYVAPYLNSGDLSPWGGPSGHAQFNALATAAVNRVTSGQGNFQVFSGAPAPVAQSLPQKAAATLQNIVSTVSSAVSNTFVPQGTKLVSAGSGYSGDDERYLFLSTLNRANLGADALAFMRKYEADHQPVSGGRNSPRLPPAPEPAPQDVAQTATVTSINGPTFSLATGMNNNAVAQAAFEQTHQYQAQSSVITYLTSPAPQGAIQALAAQGVTFGPQGQYVFSNPQPQPAFDQGSQVDVASAAGGFVDSNFQPG